MGNNTNFRTISSYGMIDKIYRDFKPSNSSFMADAVEWIGEAIQGIGYHAGFETKVITQVPVVNHRAAIPCMAERIIGVKYRGYRLPLGADESMYGIVNVHENEMKEASDEDILVLNKKTEQYNTVLVLYNDTPIEDTSTRDAYASQLDAITKEISLLTSRIYNVNAYPSNIQFDYYNVNDDYIVTSFEQGYIDILITSFILDEKGFLKIIDKYNYKEAVKWKIISMLCLSGYKAPDSEINFKFANAMWEDFRGIAENEVKVQSPDMQERFVRGINRLKSNPDAWENFRIGMETNPLNLL